MKRIFHPNVVLFLGACTEPGNFMLVTEFMAGGDLENLLQSKRPLSVERKLRFAKDAALAMNWLHGINNILHRDMKPANLLIDENMRLKVTDFGFSQLKPQQEAGTDAEPTLRDAKGPKGSALWMAPEVMMRKPFTDSIDVYAFGLILWEIWTRGVLFEQYDDFKPFIRAVTLNKERPPLPADAPQSLCELMERCWHHDVAQRPKFKEIVPMLDEVFLDVSITDAAAKSFWRRNFFEDDQVLNEKVKWRQFVKVLGRESGHSLVNIVALEELFTEPSDSGTGEERVVSVSRMQQLVTWFGPFFCPKRGPAILEWLNELKKKPWFHGDIALQEAERRLLHRDEGTFLVRLSKNKPEHPFTISVMRPTPGGAGNAPQHKRIKHVDGVDEWYAPVGGRTQCFKSLFEMIESPECRLITPCPTNEVSNPYVSTYLETVVGNE